MMNEQRSNVEKSREAWGATCPDWIIVLAQECDATTQSAVGRRLKYTNGSVCSAVIANNYKGDMALVEKRVRGELMSATVRCPVTGDISLAVCLDHQAHAKGKNRSSAFRAQMTLACANCQNSRIGGDHRHA